MSAIEQGRQWASELRRSGEHIAPMLPEVGDTNTRIGVMLDALLDIAEAAKKRARHIYVCASLWHQNGPCYCPDKELLAALARLEGGGDG